MNQHVARTATKSTGYIQKSDVIIRNKNKFICVDKWGASERKPGGILSNIWKRGSMPP